MAGAMDFPNIARGVKTYGDEEVAEEVLAPEAVEDAPEPEAQPEDQGDQPEVVSEQPTVTPDPRPEIDWEAKFNEMEGKFNQLAQYLQPPREPEIKEDEVGEFNPEYLAMVDPETGRLRPEYEGIADPKVPQKVAYWTKQWNQYQAELLNGKLPERVRSSVKEEVKREIMETIQAQTREFQARQAHDQALNVAVRFGITNGQVNEAGKAYAQTYQDLAQEIQDPWRRHQIACRVVGADPNTGEIARVQRPAPVPEQPKSMDDIPPGNPPAPPAKQAPPVQKDNVAQAALQDFAGQSFRPTIAAGQTYGADDPDVNAFGIDFGGDLQRDLMEGLSR